MRVYVYFNLHKKLFSIRAMNGPMKGKVIGHASEVVLQDVTFKVSQAGRMRVLREKKKNVHAGIVGTIASWTDAPHSEIGRGVTYNPYKYEQFVTIDNDMPIMSAKFAVLVGKRITAWN